MTKKDKAALFQALYTLRDGLAFLHDAGTLVMRKTSMKSTDVSLIEGQSYLKIDKEIGSKLCQLRNAEEQIYKFLIYRT